MRTVTLGEKKFTIPEAWGELEYWQGAAVMELYANGDENLAFVNRLLSILTKLSLDEVEALSANEYEALLDSVYYENQSWLLSVPELEEFKDGETPIDLPFFKDGYKLIDKPIESDVLRYFTAKRIMGGGDSINDAARIYCSLIACYIDKGPFFDSQIEELVPIIRKQPFDTTQRMAFFLLFDLVNSVKKKEGAMMDYQSLLSNKKKQVLESSQNSTP